MTHVLLVVFQPCATQHVGADAEDHPWFCVMLPVSPGGQDNVRAPGAGAGPQTGAGVAHVRLVSPQAPAVQHVGAAAEFHP